MRESWLTAKILGTFKVRPSRPERQFTDEDRNGFLKEVEPESADPSPSLSTSKVEALRQYIESIKPGFLPDGTTPAAGCQCVVCRQSRAKGPVDLTPDETNPKDTIGVKKTPLRLVPPALMITAAPAMAQGAQKYGPYNWRAKKVRYTVYLEAILRHTLALLDGEDVAPDSKVHHESHIAANIAIIADARHGGNLLDDRAVVGPAAKMLAEQDRTRDG